MTRFSCHRFRPAAVQLRLGAVKVDALPVRIVITMSFCRGAFETLAQVQTGRMAEWMIGWA